MIMSFLPGHLDMLAETKVEAKCQTIHASFLLTWQGHSMIVYVQNISHFFIFFYLKYNFFYFYLIGTWPALVGVWGR